MVTSYKYRLKGEIDVDDDVPPGGQNGQTTTPFDYSGWSFEPSGGKLVGDVTTTTEKAVDIVEFECNAKWKGTLEKQDAKYYQVGQM